jgi:hypothetical protein
LGKVANSCAAPSILTADIAAPSSDDKRILRNELPIVCPNPACKGSTVKAPYVSVAVSSFSSAALGIGKPETKAMFIPPDIKPSLPNLRRQGKLCYLFCIYIYIIEY